MGATSFERSATMILATEPVIVRFPASVLAMASTSHPACGFANPGTTDLSSMTAGTLLMMLESAATTRVKKAGWCRFVIGVAEQVLGEAGFLRAADDDEEPYEEDQQTPIHF